DATSIRRMIRSNSIHTSAIFSAKSGLRCLFAQRGTTLHGGPGILDAAMRLAAAAGIAIGIGVAVRAALLRSPPGTGLAAFFVSATVPCAIGSGVYLALAQLFGIRELATFERMLLRRLKLRRPPLRHTSDAPPH